MKNVPIKGIIPPIVTPMSADESVNIPELRNQIERQIAGGVHGIFPFGTNGEGYILSMKEKEEVLEATIDQVKGRIPVYAGTGCISTRDTIYMSKRAEEMGADVLSIITPSFALASQKELYDHYCEVAKHVSIPIVLYNIPARTGNKLLPETVGKLARDVDVIMGAKDSSGDIPKTLASIYNYFVAGDLEKAQEAQDAVATLSRVFKFGNPNTIIKKAVNLLGYPVGDCRKPFNYLCDEGIEELKAVLKENAEKGLC